MPVLHFVIVFHFFVVRIFLGRSLFMYYYFSNYSFRKKNEEAICALLCSLPIEMGFSMCLCVGCRSVKPRKNSQFIIAISLHFTQFVRTFTTKEFFMLCFWWFRSEFFFFFIWIQNTKENNIFKMTFIHTTRQYTTHRCQHSIESTIK